MKRRVIKTETIKTKDYGNIIVEHLEPKAEAKVVSKPLGIEMADRHLRVIEKWVKAGYITKAQAAALRSETISRVTR